MDISEHKNEIALVIKQKLRKDLKISLRNSITENLENYGGWENYILELETAINKDINTLFGEI
jgi:hypothetical protein